MFARVFLVIAVAFGLLAGPAWTREACLGQMEVMKACACGIEHGEACCIENHSVPVREVPSKASLASVDLKQAIEPVLNVVAVLPTAEVVTYAARRSEVRCCFRAALIDRICVRLI